MLAKLLAGDDPSIINLDIYPAASKRFLGRPTNLFLICQNNYVGLDFALDQFELFYGF